MGSAELANVSFAYDTGPPVLVDVSFKVGEGDHTALVGANGAGKSTALRLLARRLEPTAGTVTTSGSVAYMDQMIGTTPGTTVRDLYLSLAPPHLVDAGAALARAERRLAEGGGGNGGDDGAAAGIRYAEALARWEHLGGYDLEVRWAACANRAVGLDWSGLADRPTASFSGGEQKRLALELLLDSDHDLLLLDEPDNFLDVPGKEWLAERLNASSKTILFISHDRALLAAASRKVVTIEAEGAWTHGRSFATWAETRRARNERIDELNRRWEEERARLVAHLKEMKRRASFSETFAPKAKAAESRLRHFDERGRPAAPVTEQRLEMRLAGGRTGKRAVMIDELELTDLTFPFDAEIWFGDRIGVVGPNGTGKSHFLRLLAGEAVDHEGSWRLGAGVVPGLFSQTHRHPELVGRTLLDILTEDHIASQINARGTAMGLLRRYELQGAADERWDDLSGGQQARFQILLLELGGATLLLLDEPTDNLDVASAEALEAGLASYDGTVLAVSHDRWFLRSFDRFLVFDGDAEVHHADRPDRAWAATPRR
jgi:ATPase subunit of ABC transporter with duplicated ATPase domains